MIILPHPNIALVIPAQPLVTPVVVTVTEVINPADALPLTVPPGCCATV